MRKLRLHIARLLTFIVALQIMDMGLFVQDFQPLVASPYQINIINTVEEYVAEIILDHTNAIPESNDHQKKDFQSHKHVSYKLISISRPAVTFCANSISPLKSSVYLQNYNYHFWEDITPPPPKSLV